MVIEILSKFHTRAPNKWSLKDFAPLRLEISQRFLTSELYFKKLTYLPLFTIHLKPFFRVPNANLKFFFNYLKSVIWEDSYDLGLQANVWLEGS